MIGLILEGGGSRGAYTAGVLDVLAENDIYLPVTYGVSAGACNALSYLSKQIKRNYRIFTEFASDKRYSGIGLFLKTGNLFGFDFIFGELACDILPYDFKEFERTSMKLRVCTTDCRSGKAVFFDNEDIRNDFIPVIASSSLPVVSKIVEYKNYKLLDGGVADSIPLEYFESIGYEKNMVILTQPDGYVKEHNKLMPLMRIALRKYPNMIEAMDNRHIMYNKQLVYVYQAESTGRALVIRPEESLPIGHISHNPEEMQRVYEIGRKTGMKYIERIKAFFR